MPLLGLVARANVFTLAEGYSPASHLVQMPTAPGKEGRAAGRREGLARLLECNQGGL